MKQHITKEQWIEINPKQRDVFWRYFNDGEGMTYIDSLNDIPNIGQMIEFLGNNLEKIKNNNGGIQQGRLKKWVINADIDLDGGLEQFTKVELCDALWEAVKFKLNNL